MILALCVYIIFFEWSIGPVLFLYLAEVCCDKAISLALLVNWMCNIGITLTTKVILQKWGGYLFVIYAGLMVFAGIFILGFVKETKGLSEEALQTLYQKKKYSKLEGKQETF